MKIGVLGFELQWTHNFCLTQASIHFLKIVKSCSEQPKTLKCMKILKSKTLTKIIVSFIYTEDRKNAIWTICFSISINNLFCIKLVKDNAAINEGFFYHCKYFFSV